MAKRQSTKYGKNLKDETGSRYGNLTVLGRDPNGPHKKAYWICQCDCGNTTSVWGASLRNGSVSSCGRHCPLRWHGMAGTPEHTCWAHMLDRCRNERHPQYADWGGRGISVCERWKEFKNFLQDMGARPSQDATLDRIDNDGDYCPENCRWATRKEQLRNTRRNFNITHNGVTKCVTDWAAEIGVCANTIKHRLKRGWEVSRAVETPPDKRFYRKNVST